MSTRAEKTFVAAYRGVIRACLPIIVGLGLTAPGRAQLNQNCTVAVLNRTVQVNADGTWVLPNIPANFGFVRARATCVQNGVTTFGQSALFSVGTNGAVNVPPIVIGPTTPIPTAVTLLAGSPVLTEAGATTQLQVTATYASGPAQNISAASTGTQYNVSNPAIATVSANGLVTAVSTGTVAIQAVNEGTQGILNLQVILAGATHGGIPDSWAIAHGLDPNDPAMPAEDPDHDGLTNLQEFQAGTDPHNPDTDGDGLTDGQEVLVYKTNPLLVSTDGSGIPDGVEVQDGTLNASAAAKLAAALASIDVKPSHFVMVVNTLEEQATQQLTVTGHLIDGKTTIDLTSTLKGTAYSSSDLTVCNFGSPDGNVFAGNPGTCTITVTNGKFSAQAIGTVSGFTPTDLAEISIPGFANGVAINGNTAYIAAGSAGLQVVDVTNRSNPVIIGSLALTGNANGVRVVGQYAYVAAGSGGLAIVDVSKPSAPLLIGTLGTGDTAYTLVVYGNTAYIANGGSLLIANVTNPANPVALGSLTLGGTVEGVDVDPKRKLAVIAAGSGGLYVVDVSNLSAPAVLGQTTTGEPIQVAIQGQIAYVADYTTSTNSVDITNPTSPLVLSNITDPNLGGYLQDILVNGHFALAADVKFFNGIPITDITFPRTLQARAILNFTQRDDNGMGIAADGSYAYLVTEHSYLTKFGASGDSRLYIGQYRPLQDVKGIPPTVSISSPATNTTVVQGSTLPILVDATDDIAVASVEFLVNGQLVYTSTSYPYQFNYLVPTNATNLTIGAVAVDFGGNQATAQTVSIKAIPDPGTTVVGTTVDASSNPLPGASVTCQGLSTTSGSGGAFSIPSVPTIQGTIQCTAAAVSNGIQLDGFSASFTPVLGGTTNVGTIKLTKGATVLILTDTDGPGPNALAAALTAANNTVTLRPAPEYSWDSTNPTLNQFNCVIHLDGSTYTTPMPVKAQQALENFVQTGKGGYIGSQWDGYEQVENIQVNMPDLVLQSWSGANSQDCGSCSVTYTAVPGETNHPVLNGLPNSFTFFADGNSASPAYVFATQPSTTLMTIPAGGPGVLVRNFGSGRVVNFSIAPDYGSQNTLQDPNIQKLYINAVAWACQGK